MSGVTITIPGSMLSKYEELETEKQLTIPEGLEDSKHFKKLAKQMGEDNAREFFKKSSKDLKAIIAECEIQSAEAREEVQTNPAFMEAAAIVKDFRSALNDTIKPLVTKRAAASKIMAYRNDLKKGQ